ncbi:hypothetical protein CEXT_715281 [Caerostris extrusa]|uniref:Reverse transcriptase domain-containing protein n=1 Tax=Caerostris extrusa TaxID=172846 RepID=A0AAV4WYU8_CAEEX|nr:hypothetical protein CEXT_715281 [Caerostris extrusa]
MAKLMERMIVNKLNLLLETYGLLCNERSTGDQVIHLRQMVKHSLDTKKVMTAVYIDFKSAYGSFWRKKMIQKLKEIGMEVTASEYLIKKLELLQNQALWLIVGAVKTAPINSMLLLANNRPIQIIIEERALAFYERLTRIDVWDCYENRAI